MALPKQPDKPVAALGMDSGLISWLLRENSPLEMWCSLLSPTDLPPEIEAFRLSQAKLAQKPQWFSSQMSQQNMQKQGSKESPAVSAFFSGEK